MKCHDCDRDFPMTKLRFIEDGMVPGINMKRHRAQCHECSRAPEKVNEPTEEYPF
jgi:hypothetical protein